ncbi:MAG: hypothetical protein WC372_12390 [Candidatus Neomarinimicrobiota bacterium]|jgi:uncharacterized membrane protein YhdT
MTIKKVKKAAVWAVVAYAIYIIWTWGLSALGMDEPYRSMWGEWYEVACVLAGIPLALTWAYVSTYFHD